MLRLSVGYPYTGRVANVGIKTEDSACPAEGTTLGTDVRHYSIYVKYIAREVLSPATKHDPPDWNRTTTRDGSASLPSARTAARVRVV